MNIELQNKIKDLLDKNILNDLNKFMFRRAVLNNSNLYLVYLFYVVQSSGILISSIGATNNNTTLLWLGLLLNTTASLIQIFEKINDSVLKKLLIDITNIKNYNYIDESPLVDINDIYGNKNSIKTNDNIYNQKLNDIKSLPGIGMNEFIDEKSKNTNNIV